jgi:ABC-type multidrug transport system fused ATPase/permease subunit
MNWIKIALIMITLDIIILMGINIYTNNITDEQIIGYYDENGNYEFDETKEMGIMPSILLFNKSMQNNTNDLKGQDKELYYKSNSSFLNIVDGIVNVALFIGMFFEITINILFSGLSLSYAKNTVELYILSFIAFLLAIGNLFVIIKTIQFWFSGDVS